MAIFSGAHLVSISILEGNLGIVVMLTGVSLLSLMPETIKKSSPTMGSKGVIHTWASVHFLGSVISMSAIFFVGDKLQRQTGKMTKPQYSILVRSLTSAGLWSPFFASLAVSLSIAPNAEFQHLIFMGIPISFCAFFVTLWEFKYQNFLSTFSGFPITFDSLVFPIFLASIVIVFHYIIFPNTPILSIVSFLSPLSIIILLCFKYRLSYMVKKIKDHVHIRLPLMANEIALFLSAGFLSKCISLALVSSLGENWSLFNHFGFYEAILCFIGICLLSLLSLHPIVGISLMSSVVPANNVDNTLLAFVALSAWAVGTAISPMSGVNLSISGKYGVDNFELARSNWFYGAMMAFIISFLIFILTIY